jgi:2-polyprenyl-3-methyl-5-hydroxy-6-metoxy-1,4-benzoquinol methylase
LGCKVTGLDPNPQALHEVKAVAGERCAAGGGVNVLQGLAADALALGKQYDYIVSSQAMHHIAPLGSTLKALYRLLKPGGALLVMDFEPGLASYWAHGFHPFAAPTREEWQQLLADSGFEPPHFRAFPPLVVLKAQKAAGE